tara:strand:- start:3645 stop:3818 length:174 start_codon:yes stop_codon:yes gene_type:complete
MTPEEKAIYREKVSRSHYVDQPEGVPDEVVEDEVEEIETDDESELDDDAIETDEFDE